MTIVVVGGGIAGTYAALRARQLDRDREILLVEQEDRIGGLLRSHSHTSGLQFDQGTHLISWTGNEVIDELLFSSLPEDEWNFFSGATRDLCGLLLEDQVQEESPFLRYSGDRRAIENQLQIRDNQVDGQSATLEAYLIGRFGDEITEHAFETPLRNLYRTPTAELDPFVAKQLPLSRVIFDPLDVWNNNIDNDEYRAIVGCPEQRALPERLANALPTAYPKVMGIERLFAHLKDRLAQANINVSVGTTVTTLEQSEHCIETISLKRQDGHLRKFSNRPDLIWAGTPFALLKLLGIESKGGAYRPAARTVIVDFLARTARPLSCYYYIDYGANECFRLTNYSAFCDEAKANRPSPFTMELWWRESDIDENIARLVLTKRFRELQLIEGPEDISHVEIRVVPQGVLHATVANMQSLDGVSSALAETGLSNLLNIGLLSAPGLFFTNDILLNAEACLRRFLNGRRQWK